MLKDSWKDKINGESIVDAEDINEIAHSIINLEKSGGASVEVVQETGESESAVMSQKAVTDALAGKADKITKPWQAYTTDGNGNTVAKQLAAEPSAGGVVLYNEGGILKTNAPVEDNDATSKQYVDDGLAVKLDSKAQSLTGIRFYGIEGRKDVTKRGTTSPHAGDIPLYATNGVLYTNDPTLATSSAKENACANVGYVDAVKRDVKMLQDAALGVLYTFEDISFANAPNIYIPNGVLPTAYIEKVGEVKGVISETGEQVGTTPIISIDVRDSNGATLLSVYPVEGQFFDMPEGAASVWLKFKEIGGDIHRSDTSIKIQVKVGA